MHISGKLLASFVFGLALAAPALAVDQVSTPVMLSAGDLGTTITTNYNGFVDNTLVGGLTATTIFTLSSISQDMKTWNFNLSVANTSSGGITASRVSVFGFNTSPDLVATPKKEKVSFGASGTGIFSNVGQDANVPQIGPNIDVCFRAGGNSDNCSGGGGDGVFLGETYTAGTFVLKFAQATQSILLDNFFVRYQSIAGNGLGNGSSGVGVADGDPLIDDGSGSTVPEPASWAMMMIGFGLIGAARRRSRGVVAA